MVDRIKTPSVLGQVEWDELGKQQVDQETLQIAWKEANPDVKVASLIMQVAYVEGVSGPTQDQLMRHGGWFSSGERQPFWWPR